MELRIEKPSFKYTSGQWLFLQVPELSRWQWHPVGYDLISGKLPSILTVFMSVYNHLCARRSLRLDPCPASW
jgi:hypothetical protein